MSVVEQWRDRARALRGEYWKCPDCGVLSAVRRLVCAHCGTHTGPALAHLPRQLDAVGWSHGHLAIEALDQSERMRPVMLLALEKGRNLPLPLAESDARHAAELVGTRLDLVLRRLDDGGAGGPIVYGRKVAASPATRKCLLDNRTVLDQGKRNA